MKKDQQVVDGVNVWVYVLFELLTYSIHYIAGGVDTELWKGGCNVWARIFRKGHFKWSCPLKAFSGGGGGGRGVKKTLCCNFRGTEYVHFIAGLVQWPGLAQTLGVDNALPHLWLWLFLAVRTLKGGGGLDVHPIWPPLNPPLQWVENH